MKAKDNWTEEERLFAELEILCDTSLIRFDDNKFVRSRFKDIRKKVLQLKTIYLK